MADKVEQQQIPSESNVLDKRSEEQITSEVDTTAEESKFKFK